VERLAIPAKRALEDAKIPLGQINKVILVGGSTRMPMVQRMAQKLFMKPPSKEVDPDKVVAMGAAIQGAILAGEVKDLVLLDVTSLSLGIETSGGVFTRIIERNTQIPCAKSKIFTTVVDGQTTVEVRVYQGERELAQYNKFLGSFELRNIPPAPRGVPQIEVRFEIDHNGIVSVSAKDLATGARQKITIQSPTNLTKEEIDRMIKEAAQFADSDARLREERMIRNKANVEIEVAEKTLKDYAQVFELEKVESVRALIQSLKKALEEADYERIKSETKELQDRIFALTSQLYLAPKLSASTQETQKESLVTTPTPTPPSAEQPVKKPAAMQEPSEEEIFGWFKKQKP
jgi:molecular chaperone DnaK